MKREDTEQRWVDTMHEDRKSEILINVIQYSSIFFLVPLETRYNVSLRYLEETSCCDEDTGNKGVKAKFCKFKLSKYATTSFRSF
jgi:hypothetical protein